MLGHHDFGFQDPRLPELLFRYRARNWPDSLNLAERSRWDEYRRLRLSRDSGLSEYSFDSFQAELAALRTANAGDGRKLALLDQVEAWARDLQHSLQ
jgi:exodeoxyribonuclease-1